MNRLACLRLTERCADILISVRLEISEAGDVLGQELAAPIAKLEEYVLYCILIVVTSHISSLGLLKQSTISWSSSATSLF
jgi:hypothetical protein